MITGCGHYSPEFCSPIWEMMDFSEREKKKHLGTKMVLHACHCTGNSCMLLYVLFSRERILRLKISLLIFSGLYEP